MKKYNYKIDRKKEKAKGITLVALVITVVIMLILAGVAIAAVVDADGLFSKTRNAAQAYEDAAQKEADDLQKWMNEIDDYLTGVVTNPDDNFIDDLTNGSFDENKKMHTPKLVKGMVPVYWENDVEKELTESSTKEEWEKWYDYKEQTGSTATEGSGTSKWANAVTKDSNGNITGYYVWIPRYEYKITYNNPEDYSQGGTIDVNFIEIGQAATDGYIIHPVFQNNPEQGGWDSELPGFWIAKYPAGFQANTVDANGDVVNGNDEIQYSNLNYSTPGNEYTNVLGQELTTANYANEKMSYPVFKPLTYVYNCINIDSSFRIAQEIKNATNFYGLSNADTHQVKNSEWGAVAYLIWSQYGRNGTEPNINNVNLNNKDNKQIYAVTGMYGNGIDDTDTNGVFVGNAYNTSKGQLGSSTGNITGVYDLSGGVWERVVAYVNNGDKSLTNYGSSVLSSVLKYKNVYMKASIDDRENNYNANNFKGDAVRETSMFGSGYTSWNGDYSNFPDTVRGGPFFNRGGLYKSSAGAGLFAFSYSNGNGGIHGFRVALVSNL